MWFLLLNADMGAGNWMETTLTYAALLLVIIVSLIVLAIVKKSIRKEASLTKVKVKSAKAIAYATRLLNENSKRDLLIASTKLSKLCSLVLNIEWNVSCIVEDKKDIVLEGLSARLDALANKLSAKAEEAFFTQKEYLACINEAKAELIAITDQVTAIMETKNAF